jgi:LmbE family N-acetylglucosaminyl deacetylase
VLALSLPRGPLRVVCLAAHCDDIEIGAGGTLLRLLHEHQGSTLDWLVLSSTPQRREEELRAAEAFAADASELRIQIHELPENVMPSRSAEVQGLLGELAASTVHDLVVAPASHDLHQDHRLLAEVAHQKWRDHPIWSYEIAKWDGDLATPNLFVRLDDETARRKVELLGKHFPSQHGHHWYDDEAFLGLMRLRGIECGARYAEGFHVRKTAV